MKKFQFSLDRVLDWRRMQARREEMILERLHAELRALDAGQAGIAAERERAGNELRAHASVTGEELAAHHAFDHHLVKERERMAQARAACQQQITVQTRVVMLRRRNVKLLEKLKQRRLAAWSREMDRELAQLGEEAHLAKWNRENIQ